MRTMKAKNFMNYLAAMACALLLAGALRADRIEMADGSVLNGKIVSADKGKFKVETSFAGTIEVAQDQIRTFSTSDAVNVGLSAGSAVLGRVESSGGGIRVVAADGQMSASTGNVAAVWRQGEDSPAVREAKAQAAKAERHWAYEASLALTGRTGVSEKFGSNLGFKATLESPQDKLIFTLQAERAKDNGVDTADRQFGGVDYSSFFSEKNVWYARTSVEKDKIKLLDLRSTTAFGIGRKLVKTERQDTELRLGISYLYETYSNNTKFDSPGADVTLLNSLQLARWKLTNMISYTPAFKDFANYRVHHESAFEVPITASLWKLRLGLANDYQSEPPDGTEKLDTTYFTSLILNWK